MDELMSAALGVPVVVSDEAPPKPVGYMRRAVAGPRDPDDVAVFLKGHKGLDVELVRYGSRGYAVRERGGGAHFVVDASGAIWRLKAE